MLHAGDVFHHTRPSWSTLTHFVRQMRRLEWARIPVVVIAGNHDTPRLRTTGSVFGLLAMALPDVRFITGYDTEEQSFEELGVMVHGVPHGALINPDPPALLHHPTLRNIVVTHGVAPGFATWAGREAGEADLRGNVLDTRFDYVALGHVHLRGNPGTNAWYSGSTERTSWGDQAAQPGYALVTLADRGDVPMVDFVDLPARPMETLSPIDGAERTARDLADMILARAGALGMPHAMVRVELQTRRGRCSGRPRRSCAGDRRQCLAHPAHRSRRPARSAGTRRDQRAGRTPSTEALRRFSAQADRCRRLRRGVRGAVPGARARGPGGGDPEDARGLHQRRRVMILAAVEIENYKQYAGSHCIDFPEQGMVAITGPNGAGKTTLSKPSSGASTGRAPSRTPRSRRTAASA